MTAPTNPELIARWRDAPAPLLALLHAFHDRDGFISEASLRDIAVGLRIPLAELFGTLTFYHHFSRETPGQNAPRVCTGPVCRLQGGLEILAALKSEGQHLWPCAGRCDDCVQCVKGIKSSPVRRQTDSLYNLHRCRRQTRGTARNVSSPKFENPDAIHSQATDIPVAMKR